MKVADGVEMMEIPLNMGGMKSNIYPTLIWDDKTVILVDAGFPGLFNEIREKMNDADVPLEKLDIIIVTHQDKDHIGSIPDILNANDEIQVIAHHEEKPYIQGEKKLDKMNPEQRKELSRRLKSMPRKEREQMKAVFENPPQAHVDETVEDGEELPYCGGIIVIHTPGHTLGHICLYLKQNKTLIAGDALNIVDGELVGPNPQHTMDMDAAKKSLQKLTGFDIQNVICYHGGLYSDNVNKRIDELSR
ncbi:MAG: MBL fold metallo-hydrolase [Methanobacterium sp.]